MAGRTVIVRIVDTRGSMPRGAGAWLALSEDGTLTGSVGGGSVEYLAIERAREVLAGAPGETRWFTRDETGMACGGDALLDIHLAGEGELEALLSAEKTEKTRAFVYGAGHVASALVKLLPAIGFSPFVVDDRPEMVTEERLPGAERIVCGPYTDLSALDALPEPGDFAVVLTHGHIADIDVLDQILPCGCAYVGCIGSRRKTAVVHEELARRGHEPELVASIHLPIGEDILAETPAEIAVSIAAQLIRVRAEMRPANLHPHGKETA
ncbi:MAG: XdhC family protein [Atopobiaceae bacterium]|nr:XdhC family protein [Atopobiaceae bacterium]